MLGINLVPVTKIVKLEEGEGSLQYFIDGAYNGRALREIDIDSPAKCTWKWTAPSGRALPSKNALFFDWLTNNIDRYIDNLMFLNNGRTVLVDHGLVFFSPISIMPSVTDIRKMIPSYRVYKKLRALDQDQRMIDRELGQWASSLKLSLFKKRVHHFVKKVDQMIQKEGLEKIFLDISQFCDPKDSTKN